MNLILIIFSADRSLRVFSSERKSSLFPKGSVVNSFLSNASISVISFDVNKFRSKKKFERIVLNKSKEASHVIVMVDQDHSHLASNITASVMLIDIDVYCAQIDYQNYFHSKLSKSIKTFNFLNSMFCKPADTALLSLPFRNFKSDDLKSIRHQFECQDSISDIQDIFDKNMQLLRRRVRPRKQSKFRHQKYAVDDNKRFFIFGKEVHSLPDTGGEHEPHCELNSIFRFGFKISKTRHYNVSEGEKDTTTISGEFFDCHDTALRVRRKTHLNMFSSDFFC